MVLKALHHERLGPIVFRGPLERASTLAILVLFLLLAAVAEAGIWAIAYVQMGALPTMREALYFSLVTLTSLGYGDVTLGEPWRLLSALQSANGVLLFGWTTALIVTAGHQAFAERSRP